MRSHLRIAFITSSLEPGRDGVGDYVRRLAAEYIRQGHSSIILGLNDGQVSNAVVESQMTESTAVSVLRLPRVIGLQDRVMRACKWLDDFKADWLSLQYVCYGYHPKGLARRWNGVFAELGRLCSARHLMFHEIWIGEKKDAPFGQRLIGMVQRRIICAMHRRFQPNIATTSMGLYQRRLARRGIIAEVLPLFGNIPKAPRDDAHIAGLLRAAGSRIAEQPHGTFVSGLFFGAVHADLSADRLVKWLFDLRSKAAKPLLLIMIGRAGSHSARLAAEVVRLMADAVEVMMLGEQSDQTISQALQFADFGISTASSETLGKSGTFAAMQEHGLPVVVSDGELDSIYSQNGKPPVLQFSTHESVSKVLSYSRLANAGGGLVRTAADMNELIARTSSKSRIVGCA